MRNLVYLGLLSLSVVFILVALPRFANAGKPVVEENKCQGPTQISCVRGADIDIHATYNIIGADDDDIHLIVPGTQDDDDACNADNISFHAEAVDSVGGSENSTPNPCAECWVQVPLDGALEGDDDDAPCYVGGGLGDDDDDDDDQITCWVKCYEAPPPFINDCQGGGAVNINAHSKGQINDARGRGVNNGIDKEEAWSSCVFD